LGFDALPQFFKRDARFCADYAGGGIPFEDLIHGRHVEHDSATVQSCVVIAATSATRGYG
jgi:hypothetical protein